MTDHRDESLMDKVKNAFGMGSHDDHDHIDDADTTRADVPGRTAFNDDLADSGNRPAGPDYGASDTVETVDVDYGPPPTTSATGTEFGTGTDRGPTTMPDESNWTRGGAASGESVLHTEEDMDVDRRDPPV